MNNCTKLCFHIVFFFFSFADMIKWGFPLCIPSSACDWPSYRIHDSLPMAQREIIGGKNTLIYLISLAQLGRERC